MSTELSTRIPNAIFQKIADIMADVPVIEKSQKNTQQNFLFRGIDDMYNVLHPIMVKHGVFNICRVLGTERTEKTTRGGALMEYVTVRTQYVFYAQDGSNVTTEAWGAGMDSGDKAVAKAMSMAHKTALIQLFMAPTQDLPDADSDSPGEEKKNGGAPGVTFTGNADTSVKDKLRDQMTQQVTTVQLNELNRLREMLGLSWDSLMEEYQIKKPREMTQVQYAQIFNELTEMKAKQVMSITGGAPK